MRYAFLFIIFFSFGTHAEQEIRIALGASTPEIILSSTQLTATWGDNQSAKLSGRVKLTAGKSDIRLDGKSSGAQTITLSSPETISLDSRQYRGTIEVRWQNTKGVTSLIAIHPVPIEQYVVGIISAEVPRGWPLEVLKAQAIAARTYAVLQKFRRLDRPYHMESSVIDQVYGGIQREHSLAEQAAAETFGQVLTYDSKPIQAYFHSTCGGHTESSKEWMGTEIPYLKGGKCGYCNAAPTATWEYHVSQSDLEKALGQKVSDITIASRTPMGRAKVIELSNKRLKKTLLATDFRQKLGYFNLRSTWIESIRVSRRGATIRGRGFGHGVGMCQFGASGMARAGFGAEKILAHYYPGTEIRRMY